MGKETTSITLHVPTDYHKSMKIDKGLLGGEIGEFLDWEKYFMTLFDKYRKNRK